MQLVEMESRPERAGDAVLVWGDGLFKARTPSRDGKLIYLPLNPGAKFYPLKNGEQFLFCSRSGRCWFGGTDEQPFLVALFPDAYKYFLSGGEAGFYEALKPAVIRAAEEKWGEKAKRQGDVFAYPLPMRWEELFQDWLEWRWVRGALQGERERKAGVSFRMARGGLSLFGTRHGFYGLFLSGEIYLEGLGVLSLDSTGTFSRVLVGEGRLEAPDHSPVELKGPHILSQTRYLVHPQKAD